MSDQRGLVRTEPAHRRVRAYLGGELVVDTVDPLYVWEGPHYPQWYVPVADIRDGVLAPTATTTRSPSRGTAVHYSVRAGAAAGRRCGVALRREPDRGAARPGALRLGRPRRLVRGGRGGLRPPAQPDGTDPDPAELPPRRRGGRRGGRRRLDAPDVPPRDRAADAHLPAEDRRADGAPRPDAPPPRRARTRARRSTGRCAWTTAPNTPTSRGATVRRCASRSRSPAWSPSTTRWSTSRSTACGSRARRR